MGVSNLAVGRLVDGFGAAPMIALPGLVFIAMTVLTLCIPTLRAIYGRRRAAAATPSAIPGLPREVGTAGAAD
jgi:hypothetical protein